jgi:hypothetical protein
MAVTIFKVRATITKEQEAAFNKWYDEEHVPQVLRYNGAVSGKRYKRIMGEDKYDYMAIYEFKDERGVTIVTNDPRLAAQYGVVDPN